MHATTLIIALSRTLLHKATEGFHNLPNGEAQTTHTNVAMKGMNYTF